VRLDPITLRKWCLPDTINPIYFFQIVARNLASGHWPVFGCGTIKVTLGGHSALDPPLPIPNRAVKRSRADDSMHSYAKVGHCQAPNNKKPRLQRAGAFYCQFLPSPEGPSGHVRRVSFVRPAVASSAIRKCSSSLSGSGVETDRSGRALLKLDPRAPT
jgi:hypothetical protein